MPKACGQSLSFSNAAIRSARFLSLCGKVMLSRESLSLLMAWLGVVVLVAGFRVR
jgi:hypothetical protein